MPTPSDEICSCAGDPPIKLMWALGPNPVHCLDCNLEVEPAALRLPESVVDAVADWCSVYGAVGMLELDSGPYEAWARTELLDPESPVNRQGLAVRESVDRTRRCYFWLFQPQGADDYVAPQECPICRRPLTAYDDGIFPQLLCDRCSVVLPGETAGPAPRTEGR